MKSLAIISSTLLMLVSPSMADWPFWCGDMAGSGVTTETNLPTKWDKKKKREMAGRLARSGKLEPRDSSYDVFSVEFFPAFFVIARLRNLDNLEN